VAQLYANSFVIGMSNSDLFVVFQRFGKPVGVVNLSYTLAKTLAQRVGGLISEFEQSIDQNILTTDRIDEAMQPKDKSDAATVSLTSVEKKSDVH